MLFVSIAFVCTRRPCTSCLPLGVGKCVNSLANHQGKLFSTEILTDVDTSAGHVNLGASDSIDDNALHHGSSSLIQVNVFYTVNGERFSGLNLCVFTVFRSEYKHLSLIMLNYEHLWPRQHKNISMKTSMRLKQQTFRPVNLSPSTVVLLLHLVLRLALLIYGSYHRYNTWNWIGN